MKQEMLEIKSLACKFIHNVRSGLSRFSHTRDSGVYVSLVTIVPWPFSLDCLRFHTHKTSTLVEHCLTRTGFTSLIVHGLDWNGLGWTCITRTCRRKTCKRRTSKTRTCKTRNSKTPTRKTRTCKTRTHDRLLQTFFFYYYLDFFRVCTSDKTERWTGLYKK